MQQKSKVVMIDNLIISIINSLKFNFRKFKLTFQYFHYYANDFSINSCFVIKRGKHDNINQMKKCFFYLSATFTKVKFIPKGFLAILQINGYSGFLIIHISVSSICAITCKASIDFPSIETPFLSSFLSKT